MGILGHLFGKKKDDLGLDRHEPDIGMPSMTPTQGGGMTGFGDPLGSPDMGVGGPSPASPPGTGAPGEVSPEAFGFPLLMTMLLERLTLAKTLRL